MSLAQHRTSTASAGRLAGKPARAAAFARFVDHILRHDRVWICRRNEIAEHWPRQHSATGEKG
jgi:allantoinase